MQVSQAKVNSGSNSFLVTCETQHCQWRVRAYRSRSRHNKGQWLIDQHQTYNLHSVLCLPSTPRISFKQIAILPAVSDTVHNNSKVSIKTLIERVALKHGLKVQYKKMQHARNHISGATWQQAAQDLLSLGSLCEAFMAKNPGSIVRLETSDTGVIERIFICPGAHVRAIPALLSNVHTDAFHCKNKEFTHQIFAMSALTNQRTVFINSIGIAPGEDEENWTWFMQQHSGLPIGDYLNSGKVIFRGDREKGEEAAKATVFPMTPRAACLYHLRQNMHRLRLFTNISDTSTWYNVATAKTMAERNEQWDILNSSAPLQAAYLQDIERIKWQTCELLALGVHTHNTNTNNTVEQVGSMLLAEEVIGPPIRYRTPGPMVQGLLELFNRQATKLRSMAEELTSTGIQYSDYALGIWSGEHMESGNYRVAQVGCREWCVVRTMLITDKVRHVRLDAAGNPICDCGLYAECEVMCRHIMAVSSSSDRWAHIAAKPFGTTWLNSAFIAAFTDFDVIVPSPDEITACTPSTMFPGTFTMPRKVRGRGRPRVKRIKRVVLMRKNKMRKHAGLVEGDKGRHCLVCWHIGHSKNTCPVRARFRSMHT